MLATLSSRLLDVSVEYQRAEDPSIIVEVDGLRLPDAGVAARLAGLCGRICGALGEDVRTLSHALLALEEAADGEDDDAPAHKAPRAQHTAHRRPRRRVGLRPRPTPAPACDTLLLPSPRSGVPAIVLSPAPPAACPAGARTPWQDAAFGARLAVPGHPAFNAAHPPLLAFDAAHPPLLAFDAAHPRALPGRPDAWAWRAGRWVALLPGLDAQAARGLFSRPVAVRRRAARRR
ncbi:hypothetical protein HDZ31DRAFT_68769 [Schizophyllum fasciatum]